MDEFVNADVIQKAEGVSEIEAGRRTLARLDALAVRYASTGVRIFDNRIWTTLAARYMKPRAEQQPVAVTEQELGWTAQDIVDAMSEAVTEALRRHKARGESVVIWRDGKIVELKPEEIDV